MWGNSHVNVWFYLLWLAPRSSVIQPLSWYRPYPRWAFIIAETTLLEALRALEDRLSSSNNCVSHLLPQNSSMYKFSLNQSLCKQGLFRPCNHYWITDLHLCRGRQAMKDVAEGLLFLHNENIAHGALKSLNILIGSDRHVKIADLGKSSPEFLKKLLQ